MKRHLRQSLAVAAVLIAGAANPVRAQQAPAPTAGPRTRPADEVLATIGRSAGVVILADSTIYARLPVPAVAATPETVEQQLNEMIRLLPAGTTWVKLYAPTPAHGRWSAEVVADYARAQARLVGRTGRAAPAGTVELCGRPVPVDRANEYIAALNLKLVYLVTNPRAAAAAHSAPDWSRMTPEQREAVAQQHAQRLLALDPASRLEALRQMMQETSPQQLIMKRVMSQMPDSERVQLKSTLAGGDRIQMKAALAAGGKSGAGP